jgi:hypothetical protein
MTLETLSLVGFLVGIVVGVLIVLFIRRVAQKNQKKEINQPQMTNPLPPETSPDLREVRRQLPQNCWFTHTVTTAPRGDLDSEAFQRLRSMQRDFQAMNQGLQRMFERAPAQEQQEQQRPPPPPQESNPEPEPPSPLRSAYERLADEDDPV